MSAEKGKSVAEKYGATGRYEKRQERDMRKLYPPGKAQVICHINLSVFPISLGGNQN